MDDTVRHLWFLVGFFSRAQYSFAVMSLLLASRPALSSLLA
jgi:hypothetical protein